jgi:cellulose synthase/poly-beta-1,6-N-acetylglucosamine synthase-like glycosyltransferase
MDLDNLKVSVILPCRGMEEGLEDNIASIINQNYKSFEIIFVTTKNDKSYSVLEKINNEFPNLTKICIASEAKACSQKMQNQFNALHRVCKQAEYILFLDSDGKLDNDFIQNMVSKFYQDDIGLVTGWRWYIPNNKNSLTFIRSAWNAAVFPFLINNNHNIAFGGAMMIKKELFYSIGADKVWLKILSDGLTLASLVKKSGKKVIFAPNCIVASSENDSISSLVEWTNRQTTISRVYMKAFWRMTSLGYLSQIFLMLFCMTIALYQQNYLLASMCVICYLLSMVINGFFLLKGIMKLLPAEISKEIKRNFMKYIFWAPFANFLYGFNIVRSLVSNEIEWRGIKYKIISNTNTLILKGR